MNKKCKECGVPLDGFMYKLIAKPIFRVKPSLKKKGLCNKCDGKSLKSVKCSCQCGKC
jgi:hypothetical protein